MARQPDIAMIKEHDRLRERALTMSETDNSQSKGDTYGADGRGAGGTDANGTDGSGIDGSGIDGGGKLLRRILIGVVGVLVVVIAAPFIYLQQAGGLTGIIEAQLARQLARNNEALSLTLGDAVVEM